MESGERKSIYLFTLTQRNHCKDPLFYFPSPPWIRTHSRVFAIPRSSKSPQQVCYSVNQKRVELKGTGREITFGYNISQYCRQGENQISITATECCCVGFSHFYFFIKIAKKFSVFFPSKSNTQSYHFGIKLVEVRNFEKMLTGVKARVLSESESLARGLIFLKKFSFYFLFFIFFSIIFN